MIPKLKLNTKALTVTLRIDKCCIGYVDALLLIIAALARYECQTEILNTAWNNWFRFI